MVVGRLIRVGCLVNVNELRYRDVSKLVFIISMEIILVFR